MNKILEAVLRVLKSSWIDPGEQERVWLRTKSALENQVERQVWVVEDRFKERDKPSATSHLKIKRIAKHRMTHGERIC